MNIDNIALVRATNVIPFDGIVKPISNVPYLTKNISLEFSMRISDLLHEMEVIPQLDPSKMFDEDYYDKMVALSSSILKDYLPYVSDYNSMVLFSLNGLCPDDNEHGFANNTFSNKRCAIIEPLKYHIEETISLVPTDTVVKGDVYLSNEAIILIEEESYMTLPQEKKLILKNLNMTVKTFNCPLKQAVFDALKDTEKYTPEDLSLSSSNGGIMLSSTSEELKKAINAIVGNYGLSKMKYFNLITSNDANMPKYDKVCNEYKKMVLVQEYFMIMFLQNLLPKLNASESMYSNLHNKLYNKTFMLKIMELIRNYGLDNYKHFINEYNKKLFTQLVNETLIIPEEIINNLQLDESKKL